MKSPMITNADYIPESEKQQFSELKVLKSPAGHYIGTTFDGQPGSRDSQYFTSRAEAEAVLSDLLSGKSPIILRDHP